MTSNQHLQSIVDDDEDEISELDESGQIRFELTAMEYLSFAEYAEACTAAKRLAGAWGIPFLVHTSRAGWGVFLENRYWADFAEENGRVNAFYEDQRIAMEEDRLGPIEDEPERGVDGQPEYWRPWS